MNRMNEMVIKSADGQVVDPYVGYEAQSLGAMYQQFKMLGMKTHSDELLAQALAFCELTMGAEVCVLNRSLNAVIQIAMREFAIQGGCLPIPEKMAMYRQAVFELGKGGSECYWIKEFCERYRIAGWKKLPFKDSFQSLRRTAWFRRRVIKKKKVRRLIRK